MAGDEEREQMKLRVMVTMMAEVDVQMEEHPDQQGAAIRPTIQDNDLIISYAAYDLPENTPPGAKAPLSTVCAHMMTRMAAARLDKKINRSAPDEPMSGPTQPPATA